MHQELSWHFDSPMLMKSSTLNFVVNRRNLIDCMMAVVVAVEIDAGSGNC